MDHYQLTQKKVVHYRPTSNDFIKLGHGALVYPVDHTSASVSNTKPVRTSQVIGFNPIEGGFETMNSIYRPLKG